MRKKLKSDVIQWKMSSSIGPLFLVASHTGLKGLFWRKQEVPLLKSLQEKGKNVEILCQTILEVENYLKGNLIEFTIPLDVDGTDFQKRVWKELSKIPYGKTLSYKDIALKLKDPKKARAVGTANGKNPISLIVPCHRVINTSGALGGYAGGIPIKKKLLEMEQKITQK